MRNSILSIALVGAAIMGGIVGGGIQANRDVTAAENAWDGVVVMNDAGTVVANPSALTPTELAHSTIIDPMDTIYVVNCGGKWMTDVDCPNWKEIRYVGRNHKVAS